MSETITITRNTLLKAYVSWYQFSEAELFELSEPITPSEIVSAYDELHNAYPDRFIYLHVWLDCHKLRSISYQDLLMLEQTDKLVCELYPDKVKDSARDLYIEEYKRLELYIDLAMETLQDWKRDINSRNAGFMISVRNDDFKLFQTLSGLFQTVPKMKKMLDSMETETHART
jgi:hypothetical protein